LFQTLLSIIPFPVELSSFQIVSLISIAFITSFFSGVVGIGGGLFLLIFYASILPITAVIPVHGFLQTWNNLWRAMLTRDFHTPVLRSFILGFFVGTGISMVFVVNLPAPILKISIGVFVLISVLGKIPSLSKRYLFIGSTISMVLSFIIGGTAPMVAAMLHSFSIEPKAFVSTLGLVLFAQHGLKVAAFWLLGFNYLHYLPLMILAIIAGMLGTYLGVKIMYKLKNELIAKLVKLTLIFLAIRLIYLGASPLIIS